MDDSALAHIALCFPALRELSVAYNKKVGPDGLQALFRSCTALQSVDLAWTQVTDAELLTLARCCHASLRELNLSRCRAVSRAGVQLIVQQCSRLASLVLKNAAFADEAAAAA